ncbi:hypothetical protein C8J57DRAFT_1227591 [Mycena rebaudengoi]|nr:hypothetical protein C8J57DRAFT_1227591 [Mycena rebaudengoi]
MFLRHLERSSSTSHPVDNDVPKMRSTFKVNSAFHGEAVSIYGIDHPHLAIISFSMSDPSLTSTHFYDGILLWQYNSLFFHAEGLAPDVQHTVVFSLHGGTALFDYAVVTVDAEEGASYNSLSSLTPAPTSSESSNPPNKSKTGVTIGPIIRVVVLFTLLGAICLFLRHRRKSGIQCEPVERTEQVPHQSPILANSMVEPFQLNANDTSARNLNHPWSTKIVPNAGSYFPSTTSASEGPPLPSTSATSTGDFRRHKTEMEERLRNLEALEACVKVAKIPGVSDSDNGGQDTSFLHEVIVVVCKRATYDYICPHRRLFTRLFQRRVAVIRTTTKRALRSLMAVPMRTTK